VNLFDDAIPILSNNAQESDYEELKERFSHYDSSYVFNASYLPRRDYILKCYEKAKDYLDKDFVIEFRQKRKFIERMWELQLCSILLHNKCNLLKEFSDKRKNISRPDFCILDKNKNKIWIEATCMALGDIPEKPELKSGQLYTRGGKINDSLILSTPRITNALDKKYKKRSSYKDFYDFKDDDGFIIAINTYNIGHKEPSNMSKELALYGMGLQYLKQSGESGRYFHDTLLKRKGGKEVEIPVALFHREEYGRLSAVISSDNWFSFGNDGETEMSDLIFTYFNHNALSPVDRNAINFGVQRHMICDKDYCELK